MKKCLDSNDFVIRSWLKAFIVSCQKSNDVEKEMYKEQKAIITV